MLRSRLETTENERNEANKTRADAERLDGRFVFCIFTTKH